MTIDPGFDPRDPDGEQPSPLLAAARAALGADVAPLPGGRSGETFLVSVPGESAVVRLYVRDPGRAAVDASLCRLLRGLLPVPQVLDWHAPTADGHGAYVLAELRPGISLGAALARADAEQTAGLAASVGALLARLCAIPFLRAGRFVGADLAIEPWLEPDPDDWVQERLGRPPLSDWPERVRDRLAGAATSGLHYLDGVDRTSLVHGAVGLTSVLVDLETAAVTGLVGWSQAHAGFPLTDLGSLLRGVGPGAFADAVVASFRRAAPALPPYLVETAAGADVLALLELATRAVVDGTVRDARAELRRIGDATLD